MERDFSWNGILIRWGNGFEVERWYFYTNAGGRYFLEISDHLQYTGMISVNSFFLSLKTEITHITNVIKRLIFLKIVS